MIGWFREHLQGVPHPNLRTRTNLQNHFCGQAPINLSNMQNHIRGDTLINLNKYMMRLFATSCKKQSH